MSSDIFWFPAIWLATAAAAFYDILTVVQKCYFVATKFCLQSAI